MIKNNIRLIVRLLDKTNAIKSDIPSSKPLVPSLLSPFIIIKSHQINKKVIKELCNKKLRVGFKI